MGPVLYMWVNLHIVLFRRSRVSAIPLHRTWRRVCALPILFRVLDHGIIGSVMRIGLPDCTVPIRSF